MVTAAQMRTRMEEAIRNNDEVFSFAPNLLGRGNHRWHFFLDQYLPFPFEVCAWKAPSSRIHVWVAPMGFYDFFDNEFNHRALVIELTNTQFLSSRLDEALHETLQDMKAHLNSYVPLMSQTDADVTYEELFKYAAQYIPETDVAWFLQWNGVTMDDLVTK